MTPPTSRTPGVGLPISAVGWEALAVAHALCLRRYLSEGYEGYYYCNAVVDLGNRLQEGARISSAAFRSNLLIAAAYSIATEAAVASLYRARLVLTRVALSRRVGVRAYRTSIERLSS